MKFFKKDKKKDGNNHRREKQNRDREVTGKLDETLFSANLKDYNVLLNDGKDAKD